MAKTIDQGLKDRIIEKLRSERLTVTQAETEFGVPKNTTYYWLRKKAGGDPSTLELSRPRRENRQLKEIIGAFALDTERRKKIARARMMANSSSQTERLQKYLNTPRSHTKKENNLL